MPEGGDNAVALAALEKFVVENDELLELEERIGRFNIFDALGVARAEIRHSNFLAWLLDPAESHGQGDLFLKALLMDMLKRAPRDLRPMSPAELDGVSLTDVDIRREWRSIDLLIESHAPRLVVAIENKVDSDEHADQLQRYESTVRAVAQGGPPPLFVFLTPRGEPASDSDWVSYSYQALHHTLSRVAETNKGNLGQDVAGFLEHYLRLIGTRFMDDTKIVALCRHIYKTHRDAIDLIVEHAAGGNPIMDALRDSFGTMPAEWMILSESRARLDLLPASWAHWVPDECGLPGFHSKFWLRFWFHVQAGRCYMVFEVGPTRDPNLRKHVIELLARDPDQFGLKKPKSITGTWTRLRRETIAEWSVEEDLEASAIEAIVAKAHVALRAATARLSGVREALEPTLREFAKSGRTSPIA